MLFHPPKDTATAFENLVSHIPHPREYRPTSYVMRLKPFMAVFIIFFLKETLPQVVSELTFLLFLVGFVSSYTA